MYVCSYDLHYNVLWGRYASKLKGLTKKLLFSILPRKKDFNCKSIIAMVFEFYLYNQLQHCNVCIYMHVQYIVDDVSFTRNKRVNERIIRHYTFLKEVQFPCKISGPLFTCFTCLDISMACIIMLSGLIIIILSRSKRVNICLCARLEENLQI